MALPSTAYGPGALVTSVEGYGMTEPLRLTYLCNPRFTSTPEPMVDATISVTTSQAMAARLSLDIAAVAAGTPAIGTSAGAIRSVQVSFLNATVEQLASDDLRSIRNQLGPVCREIVQEFAERGIAYQTKHALRADVRYEFEYSRGISAGARQRMAQVLSAALGGSFASTEEGSVVGRGVYYGLILEKVQP